MRDLSEKTSLLLNLYEQRFRENGLEKRESQWLMARAVLDAFESGRHLVAEVPTGVGKSLGYLLPIGLRLAALTEQRIVISTYSRALQVQLMQKEIPLASSLLGNQLPYALCLGAQNYLCLRRLDQLTRGGRFGEGELRQVKSIIDWARVTKTGLGTEIMATPGLWARVNRRPEFCGGRKCRFHAPCFFFLARQSAAQARLLITNHALFFANMASGERVLPEFEAVVMDEAHQLEDAAASYFGVEIQTADFLGLADSLLLPSGKGGFLAQGAQAEKRIREGAKLLAALRGSIQAWHHKLLSHYPPNGIQVRLEDSPEECLDVCAHLQNIAQYLDRATPESEDEEVERSGLVSRSRNLLASAESLLKRDLDRHVYWLENRNSGFRMGATPLDVSGLLDAGLFSAYRPVVLTSGTLTTGRSFQFFRSRLGLYETDELLLESPYDYGKRAILYIPEGMPEPRSPNYAFAVANQIILMRHQVPGGFLALFTSYRLMHEVASALAEANLTLLVQGQAPPSLLLEEFQRVDDPVLLGTSTFWQGIDLADSNLRAVVITRLPFLVPDSPLVAARVEDMEASGSDAFADYQVPSAVLMFRQGFGRLIRGSTGFGVVAVLDPRIVGRSYGRQFLESLPDCPLTRRLEDVVSFMASRED